MTRERARGQQAPERRIGLSLGLQGFAYGYPFLQTARGHVGDADLLMTVRST